VCRLAITGPDCEEIVGQALRLPSDRATDPPSLHYGATSAVALQLKSAHNHGVRKFQFGGEFVWCPSPELIAKSNLQQFIEKHRLGSYDELMHHAAARTGVTRPTNETPTHANW